MIFLKDSITEEFKKNKDIIDKLNLFYNIKYENLFLSKTRQMLDKYNELENILIKKENIEIFNNLTSVINHEYDLKIIGKRLLLAWVYYSFPSIILKIDEENIENINNKDDIRYIIFMSSKNIINLINTIITTKDNIDENMFCKIFINYIDSFNKYLELDKLNMISELKKELFNTFSNMENILRSPIYSQEQKKNLFIEFGKTKKKLLCYLAKIDDSITEEILKNEYNFIKNIEVTKFIIGKELLINNIVNGNYNILKEYIDYIKKYFVSISKKIEFDIINNIDSDLIIQQFSSIDNNQITIYGNFFVKMLHNICSPVHDNIIDKEWKRMKEYFEENTVENKYIKFIVELIYFVLMTLDLIYESVLEIRKMIFLDINPFLC